MSKAIAVAAALAAVGAEFSKQAGIYGIINTQDAVFKSLKQEVDIALAMPDDPAPGEPLPVQLPGPTLAESMDAIGATLAEPLAAIHASMDGMQDVLGLIVASLPAPAAPAEPAEPAA